MNKLLICYGTRPEYLKILPLIKIIPKKYYSLLYLSQHNELLFNNNYNFKILVDKNSKNRLNNIFASILNKFNFSEYNSVLVQGDTASAAACALAAYNKKKKIIHLEAGLRTYNKENPFPEEAYRQIISRIADIHFAPTNLSKKNLLREKVSGKIFVVGNTSLDNILKYKKFSNYKNTVVITMHRRENINLMHLWFKCFNKIAIQYPKINFILPIHANPKIVKLKNLIPNITVLDHLPHNILLKLILKSKFLITDSGGIQEEGSFLNKKIIVCRKFTERPEGIKSGHIIMCSSPDKLYSKVKFCIKKYIIKAPCPYGDGKTAKKIYRLLKLKKI